VRQLKFQKHTVVHDIGGLEYLCDRSQRVPPGIDLARGGLAAKIVEVGFRELERHSIVYRVVDEAFGRARV
jgi:hypothetical protein